MSNDRLNEVKAGRYTHVLMSPEMALENTAKDPEFKKALALVVVDEVHLVL